MDNPYALYQKPTIRPTLKNPSPNGDYAVYDPTGTVSALPTKPNGIENPYAHYDKPMGNPYAEFAKPSEDKPVAKKETPAWAKVADFLTGHFPEEGVTEELVNGAPNPKFTGDAGISFLNQPGLAVAAGGVAGVKAAGGIASKLATGAVEGLGWATGGVSDIPKLAASGGKGIVKAIEAKPLAELRATREASGVAHATVPISVETGKPVVESLANTAPKTAKGVVNENPYAQFDKPAEGKADLPSVETVTKTSEVKAVSAEVKPETTGVKNAIVDEERAARGLEPLEKQTATDPFEVTKAKVDSGEINPRKLAKETVEKPRALTVEETDALIYDRQILKNEHKSIQSQIDEAIKLGDNEAEMKLLEKRSVVEENLDTLDRAADLSGTKSGQSLQARVKEIQEDYSLANMLTRARSDNGGKPLSETARKKYEDFAKRIEAANLKIKQYEDKIAAFEAQKAVGKIRNEVALEHRKIKRAATKVELDIELDSLVKELNASLSALHANPVFNAEVYTAFGKIAKNRVKAGYNTMEGLVDEVYTITKNAGLNFTKREVSDAISKYGVTSQLSKDEINVQLRELKRQMRLTSALEDAQKGITPLRSGLTRDAKTEKVLKLEKEVRQAMQENGIDVTKVKSEEEQWKTALQSFKTRTKNRITELEQKINTGDFTTKKRRDLALDKEALDLKFKKDQVIKEYHKARALDTLARRTTLEKAKDMGIEAVNTVRAIKTSVDLSAVLRQGGFIVLGHPVRGIKAMPSMFKALRSEKGQFAVEQEIMKRANYKLYEDAGLYLSEHGQKLSQMEEVYMSQWMDYNKGVLGKVLAPVRASGRAYTTYLNRLRADSFDAMLKNLPTVAGKANPVEMKAIANFINVATGRGNLGLKEGALVGLNTVFFAPRYVLSRFQLMYGQPFKGGTRVTKQMVAKEYARFLAGIAVVYSLAIASGAKVGVDPHSSDFGKIIIGNTRLDPMVGLSQTATFTTRVLTGDKSDTNQGRTLSLNGVTGRKAKEMSAEQYGRVVSNFLRSKIAPVPGAAWNWKTKKDVVGNKIERVGDVEDFLQGESVPSNVIMPLALSDIYQTMQQQGIPKGTALSLLSIFGMGMQTYNKK